MGSYRNALAAEACVALLVPGAARGDAAPARPRYQDLRFEEDWSVLGVERDDVTVNGTSGDARIQTLGGRLLAELPFWRADDDDALYSAAGKASRPGSAGSSNWLGAEIDLLVRHQLDVHTALTAGYSHFFAAGFLDESGRGRDVDFGYLISQHTF
jgi:hypothetical protein